MRGDERARRCLLCGRDVYNLQAIGENPTRALARQREGRPPTRFYRREDGTVLTSDCPVGVRALKLRLARLAGAMATFLASAGGGFWERALGSVFSLH